MLGRYALYDKIASGGMASVHIGRLLGPVGFARTVALKRMHPQFAEDPQFVSMFLDEARLAARIRHPNVVQTLDVVTLAGELFLVMEFVQGESLSHLIRAANARGERIPREMVAAIVVGALHGLHAAHEATSDRGQPLGIVHRDVSPQNILVGIDGVARVLDFGVAKAAGRMHQTTQDGQLKGKLAYMAPEQALHGTASRATDIYAASVVLWEALTGKRLFSGDNSGHLLSRVAIGCDVPPSKHAPDLPSALDDATMRGLALDPGARFATARDMARALEESTVLATASRIGDWVEAAAKDTLGERSARVANIESDSFVSARPPPPAPPSTNGTFVATTASPTTVETTIGLDSLSVTRASGPFSQQLPAALGRHSRRSWLSAIGGGLVLVLSLAALASRYGAKPSVAATATPVQSSPEQTVASISAATTGSPAAPMESSTTATPGLASIRAPTAPAPLAARAAPWGPVVRGAASATVAGHPAGSSCSVVTSYDAQGAPHFKKVCK